MKKRIIFLSLIMLIGISFGYVHVFSYQDFTDYKEGEKIQSGIITSNDDGTHGFHDRWGANNEYTFPDVEGDTNIYLDTEKDMQVVWDENEAWLLLACQKGLKTTIGLKEIPNPIRLNIMIYYDFYLDTTDGNDYSFVMYSSDAPGTIGRMWAVYNAGVFRIFKRIGRYSISELFSKQIDLENDWHHFKLEINLGTELRFMVDGGLITSFKIDQYIENIPYYSIGNELQKGLYSPCVIRLKTFVVSHNK